MNNTTAALSPLDRIAARVGIWALRRLYGANCATEAHDDFPGDTTVRCLSCEATQLVTHMQEMLDD